MPRIHVCPLSRLEATVVQSGASHVVTVIGNISVRRPGGIPRDNHLLLNLHDIVEAVEGQKLAGATHIRSLLAFARGWDQAKPMVIHCYAGISRSTAAAFISLCALRPERAEDEIAAALRAASRHAQPNRRLVALADGVLKREGRMIAAVEAMTAADPVEEGAPFALALD
ncbi:MAG: protein tyrosine phosphatase [Bauldia sp.]